ncbi:MAG: T9SS type A sorting domain-containing protein [Bacteroides sp.]|nr:T9SS type A sorting domain-containing protein [Bacteroides sp.]MCM1095277.1 T9SS type A sorting domain-containing protein [Terasakiella sp.]
MKTFTKNLYAMIAMGLVSGSASAKDIYIAATGNDANSGLSAVEARATLTSLNDIIAEGDVIHVSGIIDLTKEIALSDGIEDKNATWGHYISYNGGKHNGFFINGSNTTVAGKLTPWKNITITGEDPAQDGFDGGSAMRLFYVRGDNNKTTVTFKNLTLKNGIAPGEGGGAIFIHDNGWVEIENCIFDNNHLDLTVLTEDENNGSTILKSPQSERGGAILFQTGRLTITDSKFTGNLNRRGGAICANGGKLTVKRTRFEGNGADVDGKYVDNTYGGAIALWPLNETIAANFDHCDFIGNTTWNGAGALYILSNTDSSNLLDAVFTNCSFIRNSTVNGQGGAAIVANCDNYGAKDDKLKNIFVTFANTSFLYNESRTDGGAIYFNGGIGNDLARDEFCMVNCTLAKNSTKGNAGHGAGYCESIANNTFKPEDADRNFYNCIVEQNEAPGASEGKGEYSDLLMYGYLLTDASYYGRIMFSKIAEPDFWSYLDNNGMKDNVTHADHTGNFGDEKNVFLLSDEALGGYDNSLGYFTFVTLDAGAEQLEKGNTKYLKREQRTVTAANGKAFTLQGYDIAESDQMGFKRPEGKCAMGAMEASTDDVLDYYDFRDFPYMGTETDGIADVAAATTALTYAQGIATAHGERISVYNISGTTVAAGNDMVDVSRLPKGVYIIKAGNASLKIVR